jgi:hypothetical protein
MGYFIVLTPAIVLNKSQNQVLASLFKAAQLENLGFMLLDSENNYASSLHKTLAEYKILFKFSHFILILLKREF